ncbi:hypothetical protein PAXINDRAFT_9463 [Paxillus involutus ATCC 200175]|nr:hypothetical protein PAXINDRAFT_9463 [Paxillus involutus ATCC 200175]
MSPVPVGNPNWMDNRIAHLESLNQKFYEKLQTFSSDLETTNQNVKQIQEDTSVAGPDKMQKATASSTSKNISNQHPLLKTILHTMFVDHRKDSRF